ncbi:Hypothetical protein SRAE_X000035400 [Strongyloides ratti]|uniref:Uncharacterized protein n=1 Tax=Strongyloides ratti TaxID=34506 RepID=A0A090LS38_STRRB|nr:Hypothetical protein SRAE_X000035400 [Strongyloides ratti]CEF71027.1 Hypothetical protein SRAE_X000035400 [Strongyloides ratti]
MLFKTFYTQTLVLISFCLFLTFTSNFVNAYQESVIRPNREFFINQPKFSDNYYPNNRYDVLNKRAYWMPEKRERIVMDALGGNDYLF